LTDSDYDPPACGICKGQLTEDKVIRLTCFDLFHPECIDVHASSLPPHTAKSGYLCPICTKPIFPDLENNPLVKQLNIYLSHATWAKPLIGTNLSETVTNQQDQSRETSSSTNNISPTSLEEGLSTPVKRGNEVTQENSFSLASRKQPRDQLFTLHTDEDEEDKYQKRSITQLFVALGLVKPSKNKSKTRIHLDTRRVLVIFALITCLITVITLGMSLTSDINVEETLDA